MGLVIKCWNLLGGQFDWSGLAVVAEMFGIDDIEWLVFQLCAVADWKAEKGK